VIRRAEAIVWASLDVEEAEIQAGSDSTPHRFIPSVVIDAVIHERPEATATSGRTPHRFIPSAVIHDVIHESPETASNGGIRWPATTRGGQ
jgi:hypothetical protein